MIRPTLLSDKEFLIEAFKEEGILSGFPMTTEAEIQDSCQFWVDMAKEGAGLTYEVDGQVAAMAVLYIPVYEKLKKSALFSIVVGSKFRRQNIASKLIEALEYLGVNRYGLKIIHLEVYEKNEAARRLYEKLGYTTYGLQERFIKEEGLYFSKVLMEKRFSRDS